MQTIKRHTHQANTSLTRFFIDRQSPNGKEGIVFQSTLRHFRWILSIRHQAIQRLFVNEFEEFVRVRDQRVIKVKANADES